MFQVVKQLTGSSQILDRSWRPLTPGCSGGAWFGSGDLLKWYLSDAWKIELNTGRGACPKEPIVVKFYISTL